VNGEIKGSGCFSIEFYINSFIEKDGRVCIQGVTQGDNPQTHILDISIESGHVHLTENGKAIDNWGY
jgi:hypothetical protein